MGGCASSSCFSALYDGTFVRRRSGSLRCNPKACAPSSVWASRASGRIGGGVDLEPAFINANLDTDSWMYSALRDTSGSTARGCRSKFEVQQLVTAPGMLAQGASVLPPTPTATRQILTKVPRKMVEVATADAQALRRNLLYSATIVFVGAGHAGKRYIFERAAELGVKCVIIDDPDSWSQALVAQGVVARFIPIDMTQSGAEVFSRTERAIRDLGNDGVTGRADGITTFVELFVPFVARMSEVLGLPSVGSEAADIACDKQKTLGMLSSAGLPAARSAMIQDFDDLTVAAQKVGFPAILKPVACASCLSSQRVESLAELQARYLCLIKSMEELATSSGLSVVQDGASTGLSVMLEEHVDGRQVDVDIILSQGELRFGVVSENGPSSKPSRNEMSGVYPATLPLAVQRSFVDCAVKSLQAMGLSEGVFYVQLLQTSEGPQPVQVSARMRGGPARECIRLAWGIDLVEEVLFCALGIPSRPVVPPAPSTSVGFVYVSSTTSGTIRNTKCFDTVQSRDGVLFCDSFLAAGDTIVCTESVPMPFGLLVVARPHSRQVYDYLSELQKFLTPQLE